VCRWEEQRATGMAVGDVLDAGARLGERKVAVLDDGGASRSVKGFVFGRGQDGRALVCLELVGDGKLLAQPGNALGL
jgi:hypothetical protein